MSANALPRIDAGLLQAAVDCAPEGMAVCEARDGHWPVVFVNPAMERLMGCEASALLGYELLEHEHTRLPASEPQEGLKKLRGALREGVPCRALLRSCRQDGTLFWQEVTLSPMRSPQGEVTHFVSFHHEYTDRSRMDTRTNPQEARDPAMSTQSMLAYVRDDKLTGLLRRSYFDDQVKREWGMAQRESRRLSLLLFDLDCYSQYKEVFGGSGADQSFKRIARAISGSFRRASDLCGRFDEDQVAVLATGLDLIQAKAMAETVIARVRELAMHHPRSAVSRFVTASAGVVSRVPARNEGHECLYEAALSALRSAKGQGKNRVVGEADD